MPRDPRKGDHRRGKPLERGPIESRTIDHRLSLAQHAAEYALGLLDTIRAIEARIAA